VLGGFSLQLGGVPFSHVTLADGLAGNTLADVCKRKLGHRTLVRLFLIY
jgi:hypothetical protein